MIPINDLSRGYKLFQKEYEEKILQVLRSGWYVLGKEVDSFEEEFAMELGGECFCAGVGNGYDSIKIGLIASGIKPGDEIIMQANGYIATVLGIIHSGAIPIFIEPDEYYQLDARNIEQKLSEKTRAVLVTHLYGMAARMDSIIDVCNRNNLLLFEDCAQSHFAKFKNINTGLFGKAAFFSFYPTKTLGGFGDGGCVVSKDKEIIDKVKVYRNYGSDYRYHNIELGYNSRLDELQAALLRIKLKHIRELQLNRKKIALRYLREINNEHVELPLIVDECSHIWYQFIVKVNNRKGFMSKLKKLGVCTDISWETPPFMQPVIREKFAYSPETFPKTVELCNHIVSLPMMDYMDDEEISKVIRAVNSFDG